MVLWQACAKIYIQELSRAIIADRQCKSTAVAWRAATGSGKPQCRGDAALPRNGLALRRAGLHLLIVLHTHGMPCRLLSLEPRERPYRGSGRVNMGSAGGSGVTVGVAAGSLASRRRSAGVIRWR
jgi:hypothetical protein